MGQESEEAMFRIGLRALAPILRQSFDDRAEAWGEMVHNLYMTLRYEKDKPLNDQKSVLIHFGSILSKKFILAMQDPSCKVSEEQRDMLEEVFPAGAEILQEQAREWQVSVYDLFMLIRIKDAGVISEETPETVEVQLRTRAGITPERSKIVK